MTTDIDPVLGTWYRHLDKGQEFCVVAIEDADGVVEIQHFDGSIEAIDPDAWYELDIETTEAPENWAGALDIAERDDLGTEVTDTSAADWRAPQQELGHTVGNEALIADEAEEWEETSREGEE
ncbi:MAG: DUF6763 family protein [Gammaproteobacteria bacterium]